MESSNSIPALPVNEIRDYHRINGELTRVLDEGHPRVRLTGAEGQRLLVAGLKGPWRCVVEIAGQAGPELAAGLDAPELVVVVLGGVADGGASGMRAGSVIVLGDAGSAFAFRLAGGTAVVAGRSGPRAGLEQSGGLLLLAGPTGPLLGERQSGGRIVAFAPTGPHAGHARRAGRLVTPNAPRGHDDDQAIENAVRSLRSWLPPTIGAATCAFPT